MSLGWMESADEDRPLPDCRCRSCASEGRYEPDATCAFYGWRNEQGRMVPPDDDDGCEGHESLSGAHMGESVFCDGTCRR